ncbi:uncharacterized protein [Macrobrachium rosenbergii]|uniref:uncharacterized protein n=1 Tax=Macrobrachium rosenbergii TaxID=79674 RepID=UPI0034D657C4
MSEVEPQCEPTSIICTLLSPIKPDKVNFPVLCQNTASWIRCAAAHFRMVGISDDATKSDIVMTVLPEVLNRISLWLDVQPDKVTYTDLKNKLMNSYSMPMSEKEQLLSQPLGDTSPREAWDQLRGLVTLPGHDENRRKRTIDLTKAIFSLYLPQEVRHQIRAAEDLDMDALVIEAQKLYKATKASTHATALGTYNLSEEDGNNDGDITPFIRRDRHSQSTGHGQTQRGVSTIESLGPMPEPAGLHVLSQKNNKGCHK